MSQAYETRKLPIVCNFFPLKECPTNVFLILDLNSEGFLHSNRALSFFKLNYLVPQSYRVGFPTIFIGSLSNGDGNKNGQNAIGLDAVYTNPDSF